MECLTAQRDFWPSYHVSNFHHINRSSFEYIFRPDISGPVGKVNNFNVWIVAGSILKLVQRY